jgi:hypothetical protein
MEKKKVSISQKMRILLFGDTRERTKKQQIISERFRLYEPIGNIWNKFDSKKKNKHVRLDKKKKHFFITNVEHDHDSTYGSSYKQKMTKYDRNEEQITGQINDTYVRPDPGVKYYNTQST